jgi:hypothetical protein
MANITRPWRQLTLWLHVLTSVGWMALALALLALFGLSMHSGDRATVVGSLTAAHYLDTVLLAPLGNASAFTGLVLSLSTAWGLVHHWWVLTKFAITLVQLYLGIFVLSAALNEAEIAALASGAPAPIGLLVGTALMAGAIGFQGWLSVAKPWPRTPWARDRRSGRPVKLPTAGAGVFVAGVLAPLFDIVLGTVVGFPTPVASISALIVVVVSRRRALATA